MILSASGWRKVFAASGNEQDKNKEITEESKAISIVAGAVFFEYIKELHDNMHLLCMYNVHHLLQLMEY